MNQTKLQQISSVCTAVSDFTPDLSQEEVPNWYKAYCSGTISVPKRDVDKKFHITGLLMCRWGYFTICSNNEYHVTINNLKKYLEFCEDIIFHMVEVELACCCIGNSMYGHHQCHKFVNASAYAETCHSTKYKHRLRYSFPNKKT